MKSVGFISRIWIVTFIWLATFSVSIVPCSLSVEFVSPVPQDGENRPKISLDFASYFALLDSPSGEPDEKIEPQNVPAYFWHVFSRLPADVTVYPSENYFYFVEVLDGMEICGNIRLPAGQRDQGILSFAYEEQVESLDKDCPRVSCARCLTKADGITIERIDPCSYSVKARGRMVIFHLHLLLQEPPKLFSMRTNEVFVERTFDESGVQFFLLFNTEKNYFFWVLNEEESVPDAFELRGEDVLIGRRTGFVFWRDRNQPGRKILCMVSKRSVFRNDPFDGPFDQLADNDAEKTKIREWMERAFPALKGRIDKYGYYTDTQQPARVALVCYGMYETLTEVDRFLNRAKASVDPGEFISRSGTEGLASSSP